MVDLWIKRKHLKYQNSLLAGYDAPTFDQHGWQVSSLTDSLQSPPYPTGIILAACNDYVTFIVESTGEDLIQVSLKNLEALTSLGIPDSSCFVGAASEKTVALGVERNL